MSHLRQLIQERITANLKDLYTNLPAKVISYDAETQTASVQPLIGYTWDDGVEQKDSVIANVPVVFPSAGGGIISFPVTAGDTVLLCFSMRSIDEWVVSEGDHIFPSEDRNHELSDAIAIPGLYTKKTAIGVSEDDVEIKYKGNKVTLTKEGDIVIEGGRIDLGEGASEAIILGDAFKTFFNTHTHGDPVSGFTTTPTVQMTDTLLSTKVFSK